MMGRKDERQPPRGYTVWDFCEGMGVPDCPEYELWLWAVVSSDDEGEVDDEKEGRSRDEAIDACERHRDGVVMDALAEDDYPAATMRKACTRTIECATNELKRERDEARAEVERLRARLSRLERAQQQLYRELEEARDETERLRQVRAHIQKLCDEKWDLSP